MRSVDVGSRLRLVPFWERGIAETDRIELIIDPGPSFGAGEHPTTIMALEFLEIAVSMIHRIVSPPNTMLDVGTGTGVLAVAGKALGTGFTVGLDIDPAAVFVARRNIVLNSGSTSSPDRKSVVELLVGGAESIKGVFDIVAANLAAQTLLSLRDQLVAVTGSFLVLSGIADAMAEEVVRSYQSGGCKLVMRSRREEWNAALFEKRPLTE